MRITLMVTAVTVALSAAALGQPSSRRFTPSKSERELIAMSRAYVDTAIAKEIVIMTDAMTVTPSGLMGVAKVKGRWDAVELKTPVVRIGDDEAVVTGRVVFKGRSPEGEAVTNTSGVRIRYVREKRGWKYVDLCLGACGSE